MMVIGIISVTHGLLRREAIEAFNGSDHILHAGDIGPPEILRAHAVKRIRAVRIYFVRHVAIRSDSCDAVTA
jgi:uncharacterized protein